MLLLEVDGLTKKYGTTLAVNSLSFFLKEGCCTALLGPNGAGKTTTLRMLSGLLVPTSGTVRFHGIPPEEDRRRYIGYLPQHPSFYGWMTGREFLVYAGRLAHMNARAAEEQADKLLSRVGLGDAKKRRIGGYSGGMKQRLGIAQAMIHKPKLLIMDEPVSALDPLGRREVLEMMHELVRETTVLFSTHVLHDAEEISEDIIIVRNGEVAVSGNLKEVRKKHQRPVLTVWADTPLEELAAIWRTRYPEALIEVNRVKAQITLRSGSLDALKTEVLRDLADHAVPVNKFEVGSDTLEDVFMKVVKA